MRRTAIIWKNETIPSTEEIMLHQNRLTLTAVQSITKKINAFTSNEAQQLFLDVVKKLQNPIMLYLEYFYV